MMVMMMVVFKLNAGHKILDEWLFISCQLT